jgi:hypothetical protein
LRVTAVHRKRPTNPPGWEIDSISQNFRYVVVETKCLLHERR